MSEEEIITSPREDLEWQIRLQSKEIERLKEDNKELQNCHKDMLDINLENEQELNKLHSIIKEVREYITHYETIRGYYEYQELGYDEYNYDEDLKQELLGILDEENK